MIIDLYLILIVTIIFISIVIIMDNRNAVQTTAWLIVLIFLPVFGVILYLLFGRNYRRNNIYKRMLADPQKRKYYERISSRVSPHPTEDVEQTTPNYEAAPISRLIYATSSSPLTYRNRVRFFHRGADWVDDLIGEIEQAKKHIHLEFFILRADHTGTRVRDALLRKADQGVEVKILLDAIGSWQIAYLKRKFIKPLKSHPRIALSWFYPSLIPFVHSKANYRNHRKIAVIDGQKAYIGGMNIGDEYVNGGKFKHWRDTQVRLEGESVHAVQFVFLMDWYLTNKKDIFFDHFFPEVSIRDHHRVQIMTSGPDTSWETIIQAYFTMITEAKKEIWISTPYLIPDETMAMALKTASLCGVRVSILFPANPDHHVVYWASLSYFADLMRAGIRIYLYQEGFLHAKAILVDDKIASVGSANFDMRSFYTNFEINAVFYHPDEIRQIKEQFLHDLRYCKEVTMDQIKQYGVFARFRNSLARLLSPLF